MQLYKFAKHYWIRHLQRAIVMIYKFCLNEAVKNQSRPPGTGKALSRIPGPLNFPSPGEGAPAGAAGEEGGCTILPF